MKSDLVQRMAANPAAAEIAKARKSLASTKRVQGGRKFEDELEDTHHSYHKRRWGSARQHHTQTSVTGTDARGPILRLRRGGNPVDFTGHVNLERWAVSPTGWRCCTPDIGVRIPIQFDAKRTSGPSYIHDKDSLHQLLELRETSTTGAAAFLLVFTQVDRAFMIGPSFLETLMRGKRVTLYVTKGGEAHPVLPSCAYVPGFGWNYAPLVPLACPLACP